MTLSLGRPNDKKPHTHFFCNIAMFKKLFRDTLEKYFSTTRRVHDYCIRLSVPYRKLSQMTKLYVGKTPKQFIDERVVLEGKRLLMHTNMSIKEISYTLGFDEPTNMTKFFKAYTNCRPSDFRQERYTIS